MSFSSAQWTIPELCVWIVTRSRAAVNGLLEPDIGSLRAVDRIHPGVYAVRDDVVAAAQDGSITITCAGKPDRQTLSARFWEDAEIADSNAGWMAEFEPILVARRADRTGEEYYALRVSSVDALALWHDPQSSIDHHPGSAKPVLTGVERAAGRRGAGDGAERVAGSVGTRRSGSQTSKASQAEHDEWMKARVRKLIAAGVQSNVIEDAKAARAEPPEGLGARNDRNMVRIARKAHAPRSWQKTDVRRQK